jgi:hypothetical protein
MIPTYIKMFPEPVDIFADKIEEHSKFFFPLFSIDLGHINPDWAGQVHMVQFNEDPYNTDTVDTFNDYCKECMIGFDVIDGKYSFKTSFKYFDLTDDCMELFEKTKASYYLTKQKFAETGVLTDPYNNKVEIFGQIGNEPEWTQSDETPNDPDGNPMTFIAKAYTSEYSNDSCDKDIYLFYSDKHNLAVLLYQIT